MCSGGHYTLGYNYNYTGGLDSITLGGHWVPSLWHSERFHCVFWPPVAHPCQAANNMHSPTRRRDVTRSAYGGSRCAMAHRRAVCTHDFRERCGRPSGQRDTRERGQCGRSQSPERFGGSAECYTRVQEMHIRSLRPWNCWRALLPPTGRGAHGSLAEAARLADRT